MVPTKEEAARAAAEARPVPFDIDLNETPASSPPAGDSPEPVGKDGAASSGEDRKGKTVLLDINAIPSDEEEGKERGERGELLSSYARMNVVRDASSTGNSNNSSVTCSNLLFVGNQYDYKRGYGSMPSILRSSLTDVVQQRTVFGGSLNDGDVYPVLLRTGTFPSQKSNGMQFESMFDVAQQLGLVSNFHTLFPQDRSEEFNLLWNSVHLRRARKELSTLSRTKNLAKCQKSLKSDFPVKVLLGAENMDPWTNKLKDSLTLRVDGSPATDDYPDLQCKVAFPVQFEDFFVLSVGEVDPRPSYRSESQIWPVGYRSSWHDKITGSIFVCNVSDGGNAGPVFKVQRYPCSAQHIADGSTILSRASLAAASNKVCSPVGTERDEDIDLQMIFLDLTTPCLDSSILSDIEAAIDVISNSQPVNGLLEDSNFLAQGLDAGRLNMLGDDIGEFLVEGRSSSSVWKMVSEKLVQACYMAYKQTGQCHLHCMHDNSGIQPPYIINQVMAESTGSLAKFCPIFGPMDAFCHINSDDELAASCQALKMWLGQDRFGLDVDFVQEIIEQLPGVHAFSDYVILHKRIELSKLQTVGNGFLLAKRIDEPCSTKEDDVLGGCKKSQNQAASCLVVKDNCPPCSPLNLRLPENLIGDVLQLWELLWRFSEVLGLEEPVSFSRLEEELLDCQLSAFSSFDSTASTQVHNVLVTAGTEPLKEGTEVRPIPKSCSACIGQHLTRAHCSMLKLLFLELQSKVAMSVDSTFENGEFKSRKRRKTEGDNLSFSKKAMLDLLPINEITWPELARRYLLTISSMDGNFDPVEITSRESFKVSHCLQGHSRVLGGSIPGVAGIEADALLLAEAAKQIYGSSADISEDLKVDSNDSDAASAGKLSNMNEGGIPEWAKVLEPVRKLPTNVGARIRNCVYEALSKNPPAWAKRRLEQSISKEIYKGNASGPTKRAVLSLLADVHGENVQQKPDRKRKLKVDGSVSDLIMKQCQRVLRLAVAAGEGKVFCNSVGRALVNTSENDDERMLGGRLMASRPLDFRSIDVRLACGVYGGSHVAFLEDVREVWNQIRTAYSGRSDLVHLVAELSQNFELLYEKEVLTLVHKLADHVGTESINSEMQKEMESVMELVGEIPKAPWDEGVCKVCAVDRDDCKVLLCDKCDSGYHTYCLNPPLAKVPVGNWYCPSCVDGHSLNQGSPQVPQHAGQSQKRRRQGDITHGFLGALARLCTAMEVKDYWEYTVEERILLLKLLGDELLSSSCIREHLEHCASVSVELQQKLRSLLAEWQNLKLREELLAGKMAKANAGVATGVGVPRTGGLAFPLETYEKLVGQTLNHGGLHLPDSYDPMHLENGLHSESQAKHVIAKESWLYNSYSIAGKHSTAGHSCFSKNLESDCPADEHSCEENGHELEGFTDTLHSCAKGDSTKNPASVPKQLKNDSNGDDTYLRNCKNEMESNKGHNWMFPVYGVQGKFSVGSRGNQIAATTVPLNPDNLLPCCFIRHNPDEIQSCEIEAEFIKNRISLLQESIACMKFQLEKVSMRKDLLGCDAGGRWYWTFSRPGSSPFVVVDAAMQRQHSVEQVFSSGLGTENVRSGRNLDIFSQYKNNQVHDISKSSQWFFYQTDAEIEELIKWLKDKCPVEKSLLESLLEYLNFKHPNEPVNSGPQASSKPINGKSTTNLNSPVTRALAALEKKYGALAPDFGFSASAKNVTEIKEVTSAGNLLRCGCLELLCPCRYHCQMCHHSFSSSGQLQEHNNAKCRSALGASQQVKVNDNEKRKVMRTSEGPHDSAGCELGSSGDCIGAEVVGPKDSDCPYDFEEISARFITNNSMMELVKEIGLLGSEGVPSFLPSSSTYLNDTSLELAPHIEYGVGLNGKSRNADRMSRLPMICNEHNSRVLHSKSASGNKSPVIFSHQKPGNPNGSSVRDSSLKPLVGRGRQILRQLKINLLDMDAALLEEALKPSKVCLQKRCAWRAFVKSAKSVFEMVQATIVFEDMIKTEFLKNEWWYWSSLSAASKIGTVSSLALRLYTLDAAIIYEKPEPLSTKEAEAEHNNVKTEDTSPHIPAKPIGVHEGALGSASIPKPSSKPVPKAAGLDPTERSKPQSKPKKKRKA